MSPSARPPLVPPPADAPPMERLLALMARLRDPQGGCPWDLEQTFATIAHHTIEEAYEVADAIEQRDMPALMEELGDLLFQVVFYAQMASEEGLWSFNDVAAAITDKMIRRHPHVFGEQEAAQAGAQVVHRWEAIKAQERAAKAADEGRAPSALDGVINGLPALTRALKLQKRAARVGFDWTRAREVLDKIEEEVAELRAELDHAEPQKARIQDEMGDLFFALVNLARHVDVEPEAALRGTNAKFERRFRWIEKRLAQQGRTPQDSTLAEMENLWGEAKREERALND